MNAAAEEVKKKYMHINMNKNKNDIKGGPRKRMKNLFFSAPVDTLYQLPSYQVIIVTGPRAISGATVVVWIGSGKGVGEHSQFSSVAI